MVKALGFGAILQTLLMRHLLTTKKMTRKIIKVGGDRPFISFLHLCQVSLLL